jgi:catechol 2,3-dioxygenase-like lactoylglutathione lyase family enzyme
MTTEDFPVFPAAFYAGIVTARYHETWDFYTTHLGFRTVEECDHWVRLQHPGGAQLVLLREEAGHTPADLVSATRGHGWWLTLEVADPVAERAALRAAAVPVQAVPTARWWRPDSFAVRDPNGVLVILTPRASLVRPSVALTVVSAA